MSRKRTGLRNKYRHGRGSYSVNHKSRSADTYGQYERGRQTSQDIIAGHVISTHVAYSGSASVPRSKDVIKRARRVISGES